MQKKKKEKQQNSEINLKLRFNATGCVGFFLGSCQIYLSIYSSFLYVTFESQPLPLAPIYQLNSTFRVSGQPNIPSLPGFLTSPFLLFN